MPRNLQSLGVAVALLTLLSGVAFGQPASEREEQRRRLLDKLGLEKGPPRPPDETTAEPPNESAVDPSEGTSAEKTEPLPPGFVGPIHRLLINGCRTCHTEGGVAGKSGLLFSGNLRGDHGSVLRFIDRARSERSVLLLKASGAAHGGGAVFSSRSPQARALVRWISEGAHFTGERPVVPQPDPAPVAASTVRKRSVGPPTARPPVLVKTLAAPAVVKQVPVESGATQADESQLVFYHPEVHQVLLNTCGACHTDGGAAGTTSFVLSGDAEKDFYVAAVLVDHNNASASVLLTKGAGEMHGGGAVMTEDSEAYQVVKAWIAGGARGPGAPPRVQQDPLQWSGPVAAAPSAHTSSVQPLRPSGVPPLPPARHALADSLQLNGRFDLNFERRGIGDAQAGGSHNQMANYHRFVFLTRENKDDPFGFTVELLSLQLWQAHLRIDPETLPVKLWIKTGKLLVPFGTEPLFHQYYGGHGGFDQRLMPIIWSREGIATEMVHSRGDFSLTWDLYAVRGFRLREQDAVLNLQNDASNMEDVRFGYGQRLGAAWGPVSAWYSSYLNGLGFDRLLFMQALDVSLARAHGVPVLEKFTAGAGLVRADVSGGGPGRDYYHFASYFRLCYYPVRFLYFQYRQGLRTINNRRYLTGDDTRWGAEDGSTHNLAVWARFRGVSVGLTYFFNLEKANEIDDDLFRATVVYEF